MLLADSSRLRSILHTHGHNCSREEQTRNRVLARKSARTQFVSRRNQSFCCGQEWFESSRLKPLARRMVANVCRVVCGPALFDAGGDRFVICSKRPCLTLAHKQSDFHKQNDAILPSLPTLHKDLVLVRREITKVELVQLATTQARLKKRFYQQPVLRATFAASSSNAYTSS